MARKHARGRSQNAKNARFNRTAHIFRAAILDLARGETQTENMAHIYLTFDFGKDEERAQQARHKLDAWKQAFRLDKKMQGKFDRKEDGAASPVKEEAGLAGEGSRHPQKAGQNPAL